MISLRSTVRKGVALASVASVAARSSGQRFASSSAKAAKPPALNMAGGAAAIGLLSMVVLGSGSRPPAETEQAEVTVVVEPVPVVAPSITEDQLAALEARVAAVEKELTVLTAKGKNSAFLFIKPHAVTDKVKALVADGLSKAGIKIQKQGELSYKVIDEQRLIDNHYGAIASKAVSLKPEEQNVPDKGQAEFEKLFGESWEAAVKAGKVFNAADACKKLGINGAELDSKWSTLSRGENLLKFGGGHYVGKVDDVYVINGFYMSMRDKYCTADPPAKIHYYVVEWDPAKLSWEEFRAKVLGGTDPVDAADGSLRKEIYQNWESLGLGAQPDVGDNGVHGSASPFEAMAERINWTGASLESDPFGKAALSLGLDKAKLESWMKDAQVEVDGKKTSIFDFLEDQNSAENLDNLLKVKA